MDVGEAARGILGRSRTLGLTFDFTSIRIVSPAAAVAEVVFILFFDIFPCTAPRNFHTTQHPVQFLWPKIELIFQDRTMRTEPVANRNEPMAGAPKLKGCDANKLELEI